MSVVNCINESAFFFYINSIVDMLLGVTLCLFSCKCKEKALAFLIGIHGGFWTGVIFEIILSGNCWFIGGLIGGCLFGVCCLISRRCGRLVTVFVAVSKCLFWIFICSAQGVGIYDENIKIFCCSVIGGLVCGIVSELFYSEEEIIMCCHVLLGSGLITGVISNFLRNPRYELFGDIINNKSELLEYVSFFYKMNFWDDGHLIYLIFFCFIGMECQIIMRIREKKRLYADTREPGEMALEGCFEHGRCARVGNDVLYDCGAGHNIFIKSANEAAPKKLKAIAENFAVDKISSSNRYFYLSGRETSDVWDGRINVLVVDINGNVVAAKKCCCILVYACENTVFGYYNGDEEDEWDESSVAWDATRREVTHFEDEEEFLKNEDAIENWTELTGDVCTVAGKEWFRQEKDEEHSVPYYTDTVYCELYYALEWLNYADGKVKGVSGPDSGIREKYMKQIWDIMGGREKNVNIAAWQSGDRIFVVCRVYSRSGAGWQHFTKDIERSLLLQYDPDRDSLYAEEEYEGKEAAYWDGNWVIYREGRELFLEDFATRKERKVFESDEVICVDVSGDIVTLWDVRDEELNHSHTVIL